MSIEELLETPSTESPPPIEAPAEPIAEPASTEPAEPKQRRVSVRETLEAEFAKARTEEPAERGERRRDEAGRFLPQEPAAPAEPAAAAAEPVSTTPKEAPTSGTQPPSGPPPGWLASAKATWNQLPPDVQQSVIKRETEFSNGIKAKSDELKSAQEQLKASKDVEAVFEPFQPLFKQHGRSTADVARAMMGWFQVLSHQDPAVRQNGLTALAQSFNVQMPTGSSAPAPQAAAQPAVPTEEELPPELAPFLPVLENLVAKRTAPIYQSFEQQQQAQIGGHIASWSADKPHFAQVRGLMGTFMNAGQVPLLPDGRPDLDFAYQMAINAHPQVRAQIEAEQRAKWETEAAEKAAKEKSEAEAKAAEAAKAAAAERARKERDQKAKVANARAAAVSVSGSAPIAPSVAQQRAGEKRKSVRESILSAIEEARA